jgi:hypothetical protein
MSKADSYAPPPKIFSHSILVDGVPEQGLDVTLSADAPTRQALAKAGGFRASMSPAPCGQRSRRPAF